ncbi:hypothetical protein UY3_01933 [Chelonia mydas]|uniref:DNA2/NAM7 helicase-like C-terminal domain-containing protein n=1 Tax=Chelonia mydas TaxID=8469 RepID=M7CIM0_CHEMY|nr:hypothetical protein UY3_01933 [Chelonia mydas]
MPLITVPATEEIPDSEVYYSGVIDCEEVQQSFGSPTVNFYDKSASFPVCAFGPEDKKYETSVPVECLEERQGEFIQPVFSNATSQNRQSKWLKYQNTAQCDLITQNRGDVKVTDYFCADNVFGMPLADTRESQSDAMNKSLPDSVHLQMIKGILGKHGRNFSSQDSVSEGKILSMHLNQIPIAEEAQKVLGQLTHRGVIGGTQDISISELSFPSGDKVKCTNLPKRQTYIPTVFQSYVHYKQIFTAALTEQLNILLFELSQRLHKALSKVNTSFCTSVKDGQEERKENCVPLCNHKHPAKLVMVKKEGQNKPHFRPTHYQFVIFCGGLLESDTRGFGAFLDQREVGARAEAVLQRNARNSQTWGKAYVEDYGFWLLELQISQGGMIVYALLVCNASTELTTLRNMLEYFNPATLPLMKYLLEMPFKVEHANRVNKRKFIPPALNTKSTMMCGLLSPEITLGLARKMIQIFQLNPDQASALIQIAQMMASPENDAQMEKQAFPITIIHGVFGAGKSYLLSVVVLFLVQLFENSEAAEGSRPTPWKLLIASSTNVAVDRVLLGLLDLGFEDFIRVGSVRKIAKPVLPYRFECEKLILVGDPKQLPPTIQGSEGAHDNGLEQTLFDRLCLMAPNSGFWGDTDQGHDTVFLRTQYRCHPAISAVVNDLFYEGNLLDGISEMDRSPLLDWLPTLCFFNVNGTEQKQKRWDCVKQVLWLSVQESICPQGPGIRSPDVKYCTLSTFCSSDWQTD